MALRPPLHRADVTPVYVLESDTAWDTDRIDKELAQLKGDAAAAHPVVRYHAGTSRADMSTVAAYLDDTACQFVLKRMNLVDWTTCQSLSSSGMHHRASIFALRMSLVEIRGHEMKFERGGRDSGSLTDDDAQAIRELIGDQEFIQLGSIAINCSRELLETEKKP